MVSGILAVLLATLAIAQARPTPPPVTSRSLLPIQQGPITFVDPKSPCPPRKDRPVRVGSIIVNPPLLEYTPPRVASSTGRVIVEATIQDDGTVGSVRVLRGPTELHEFALEAVRQWKFARTCLNGTAIRIVQTVVLTFPRNEETRRLENLNWYVKDATFKVIGQNSAWVRLGWNLTVQNLTPRRQTYDLTVEFLDDSGLVIDTEYVRPRHDARSRGEANCKWSVVL